MKRSKFQVLIDCSKAYPELIFGPEDRGYFVQLFDGSKVFHCVTAQQLRRCAARLEEERLWLAHLALPGELASR